MIEMTRAEFMNLIPVSKRSNRVPGRRYGLAGGTHEGQFDAAHPGETVSFILVNSDSWGMIAEALIVDETEATELARKILVLAQNSEEVSC